MSELWLGKRIDSCETLRCGLGIRLRGATRVQVIDGVIHKYEQGFDGEKVFEDYEKGLQALLAAYTASSLGQHFHLPQHDATDLHEVILP